MISKEIIVQCESGLHNQQVTYFVQKANEFRCSIWLEAESRQMNAKSFLGMMSLDVMTGTKVKLRAEGVDAQEALDALEQILLRDVY